ncbi:hypothetical protein [Aliiglaciecola lipolytica]|uniref:hypothetical protein n=1 Tax=Aliiglaciecola lipolytica TaxID=477689 RepID=UPI001C09F1F1|nr:hypothetical protein [Aliiglaciecola lipolytica]MBU2878696.1 hypothetical protein [Aliiglaciecola lipolytica]
MSKIIKLCKVLLLTLVACLIILTVLIVESKPIVVANASVQVDDADTINLLLSQARQVTRKRYIPQTIVISKAQMNSIVGFLQRAVPEFSGQIDTSKQKLGVKFSYKIPINWLTAYVNFEGELVPAQGIKVANVHLGDLPISGDWAISMMTFIINRWTKSDLGDLALNQVSEVTVSADELNVRLIPIHEFLVSLNEIKNGLSGSGDEELKQRVSYYLTYLDGLSFSQHPAGLQLADYINPLFKKVKVRTAKSSAVLENESALLALAIYVGHHRMANFIGDVQPYQNKVVMPYYRPLLRGRSDLTQHFVISAAIKILTQQGISNAVGEFKELMDRAEGGSGFSFADLAADLAGIKLAVMAIDPQYAEALQDALAQVQSEDQFFPIIDNLPEGLSKDVFSRQYGNVESEEYKEVVRSINRQIENLPLYQDLTIKESDSNNLL